jgi:TolB-like protein/Flp pilus assembly protein TadD
MLPKTASTSIQCFGAFEVNLCTGELRKKGVRIKLQEQPFQVLAVLLQNPGELVTRERLRSAIWPADTFVDFDNSLNAAVNKLREALGDSADNPRFIETLPRRGYRFIVPVISPSDHGGRSRGPISSMAVLPFANVSGDANGEYLSDGITEDVIDKLSALPGLKVISRTSSFRYKKEEIEPQKIGRELGVEALIVGTIAQCGHDVRISVELVDAREDRHLWGAQYSRSLADISSVQREIATAVSESLRIRLTQREKKRLAKVYTTSTEAYQLYLKGRYFWSKNTQEGLQKGIQYFEQAIARDPGNAQAYAGLANCYNDLAGGMAYRPPKENFLRAKAAATRALEIDEGLAEAHTALGWVRWAYEWDWPGAERELSRAIELDPSSAVAHGRYASYLVTMGRFDEGVAEGKKAQDLDPLEQRVAGFLGYDYLAAGRYDESICQLQKALELDPTSTWVHAQMGWAYARKGMYEQAIAEHERMGERAYAVSGENQVVASGLAWVYALAGKRNEATRILEAFNEFATQTYVDFYQVGVIYAALGDKDQAFRELEKSYAERSGSIVYIKADPFWDDGIRADPRYADLLCRMKLPGPLRSGELW